LDAPDTVMSLLSVHLEQIGYSCQGIDSLPYDIQEVEAEEEEEE
jgi:hypothetical protein